MAINAISGSDMQLVAGICIFSIRDMEASGSHVFDIFDLGIRKQVGAISLDRP